MRIRSAESAGVIFGDPERSVLNVREHRKPRKARQMAGGVEVARSIHVLAAVDGQGGAGDEVGFVGGDEDDAAGDVCRGAEAPAGDFGDDFLQHVRRDGADPVSYTHLDVYKRQVLDKGCGCSGRSTRRTLQCLFY